MRRFYGILFSSIASISIAQSAYSATYDLVLSLLIDVSGSISDQNYILQYDGYAAAFRDTKIQEAILGGDAGQIAVNVIEFADFDKQRVRFTTLDTEGAIDDFADLLDSFTQRSAIGRTTDIDDGIEGARNSIASFLIDNVTTRTVIDVSGDGEADQIGNTRTQRDLSCGTSESPGPIDAINGIAIGGTRLETFYQENVICGEGSFVISTLTFDGFATAISEKLLLEIGGTPDDPEEPEPPMSAVPIPPGGAMAASAFIGLGLVGSWKRRRKNNSGSIAR